MSSHTGHGSDLNGFRLTWERIFLGKTIFMAGVFPCIYHHIYELNDLGKRQEMIMEYGYRRSTVALAQISGVWDMRCRY